MGTVTGDSNEGQGQAAFTEIFHAVPHQVARTQIDRQSRAAMFPVSVDSVHRRISLVSFLHPRESEDVNRGGNGFLPGTPKRYRYSRAEATMGRSLCALFACLLTFPLLSQTTSSKSEVATVTAVNVHQSDAEGSRDRSYDVSLKVGDTVYVVWYTPPSGAIGVEYSVGMDVVVLVGNKTITFTKLGRTSEVPILRRETLPTKTGFDWSRAPSEYFSQKLQHLSEKLDLSADQQAKIKPILEQEAGEAGELTSNPVLSSEDKLNKLEKIVHSSDQKLKPILSADQWQTLQNMRKEQKRELKESIAEKPKAQ